MPFQSLGLVARRREPGKGGTSFTVSLLLHAAVAFLVVVVPLMTSEPTPARDVSGIFDEPFVLAAPPPPPPPPPVSVARRTQPRVPSPAASELLAPVDVSSVIESDTLDLGPVGDVGGVEGGVLAGLVGGIVGGLPPVAPPAPPRVVRVSTFAAPKLLRKVAPSYPELALRARVSGVVVVEADVDSLGSVTAARVLSGPPLLQSAALAAVQQWRYQPLLLSGEPTAFVVTVSVSFTLDHR